MRVLWLSPCLPTKSEEFCPQPSHEGKQQWLASRHKSKTQSYRVVCIHSQGSRTQETSADGGSSFRSRSWK